jgi:hypothetical protein
MADFWDKYQEATNATDPLTKLRGLTECITECDDNAIKRLAAYDLGIALYQGKDGLPQDKDKGKRLMQLSADLDYGPAMNLYGQMLTHEGDLESITYFCMALDAGEIMAAKNLHDLYKACSENGASQVCNAITAGVGEVARIQREDKPEDENGKSITVRMVFSHPERTLTKDEVLEVVNGIAGALEAQGITIKGGIAL